jgi:hypothetical protein
MTDSFRQTRVEKLDREHPGLRKFVDEQIAGGQTLSRISELVREAFAVKIHTSALHNYRHLRWAPDSNAMREVYRQVQAEVKVLMEETSADPNCDAAKMLTAYLKSAIFRQKANLDKMDVAKLMAEERKRSELELHGQEIEIERGKLAAVNKALEIKVGQLEKARATERGKVVNLVGEVAAGGAVKSKDELLKQLDEIYGVYQEANPLALPGEVGGG